MTNITLMDGGLGQELIRRSGQKPTPLWASQLMLEQPDLVAAVHLDFIRAGAEVITLNNYTATPQRLARDASADLLHPIHQNAIGAAQSARNTAKKEGVSHDVKIAGCLGPLIASYHPDAPLSEEICLDSYRQLVAAQQGGVNLFMCETLATIREAKTATIAAKEAGLPVWVSLTLNEANPETLRSGEALPDAVKTVLDHGADAVMINCNTPETINKALPSLAQLAPTFGAYANGFVSVDALKPGGTVSGLKAREDLTPTAYARYAIGWAEMGAQLIGGCCEVGPDHIAHIRRSLDEAARLS